MLGVVPGDDPSGCLKTLFGSNGEGTGVVLGVDAHDSAAWTMHMAW